VIELRWYLINPILKETAGNLGNTLEYINKLKIASFKMKIPENPSPG
jgi:hypothetical protein